MLETRTASGGSRTRVIGGPKTRTPSVDRQIDALLMASSRLAAMNFSSNLPIRGSEFRFAIGDAEGLTSNSCRIWVGSITDVYLAFGDMFKEAKVSLHASGR